MEEYSNLELHPAAILVHNYDVPPRLSLSVYYHPLPFLEKKKYYTLSKM